MKKVNIKELNKAEIGKMIAEAREELRAARFTMTGGKSKDVKAAQKTRRQIARLLTAEKMSK